MVPHFNLNIFPDVLAIQTDTGHQNSRMYRMDTVRVLQSEYRSYKDRVEYKTTQLL